MRTTLRYENRSVLQSCTSCGREIPLEPCSIVRRSSEYLATTCRRCGALNQIPVALVYPALTACPEMAELEKLATGEARVAAFRTTVRRQELPGQTEVEGSVSDELTCPACGLALVLPEELGDEHATALHCSCGKPAQLAPTPRWLHAICPQMTHLLSGEDAPTRVTCAACGADHWIGAYAPRELYCERCKEPLVPPNEVFGRVGEEARAAQPVRARLTLSPLAASEQPSPPGEQPSARSGQTSPPMELPVGVALLIIAALCGVFAFAGALIIGRPFAFAGIPPLVIAVIGVVLVRRGLRQLRRLRARSSQLAEAERKSPPQR